MSLAHTVGLSLLPTFDTLVDTCVCLCLPRDSVSAIKRLLRELFAEQLALKQRLADAESAATAASQLQAADDYRLQQALGSAARWSRAPVRMSGHITAAGVLPWSQVSWVPTLSTPAQHNCMLLPLLQLLKCCSTTRGVSSGVLHDTGTLLHALAGVGLLQKVVVVSWDIPSPGPPGRWTV